jgi:CheY-like chemotaxis protein
VNKPVDILLVDDVSDNLVALAAIVRRDGLRLHQARSGPEALEILLVEDIALALLDVQMPDMDGFELAELMRGAERTRRVPIIFVTANHEEPHRAFQGYDAGAVDYLIKPLDPLILRHKVESSSSCTATAASCATSSSRSSGSARSWLTPCASPRPSSPRSATTCAARCSRSSPASTSSSSRWRSRRRRCAGSARRRSA